MENIDIDKLTPMMKFIARRKSSTRIVSYSTASAISTKCSLTMP